MLLALILNSSYSSLLRSYFFRPSFSQPIDDLAGILSGDVPWEFIEYGEGIEVFLATSKEPQIRQFWDNRLIGSYGLNMTKVCKARHVPNCLFFSFR